MRSPQRSFRNADRPGLAIRVHTKQDENGFPIPDTGHRAPVVLADKCVGCGLCQTRCFAINVREKGLLEQSAIIIEAGPGKEDRMMSGSYRELRREEKQQRESARQRAQPASDYLIPDDPPTTQPLVSPNDPEANPFSALEGDNPFK